MEVETDRPFSRGSQRPRVIHIGPYKEGEVLPVLTVVAIIGKPEDKFETVAQSQACSLQSLPWRLRIPAAGPAPLAAVSGESEKPFASPRARKLAAEKNIDLAAVPPTGYGGLRVAERMCWPSWPRRPGSPRWPNAWPPMSAFDLRAVAGTGPGGRIVKDDIARASQSSILNQPSSIQTPQSEILEAFRLKACAPIIAERMAASVHTTAA